MPQRTQRTSGWLIPGLVCLNRLWQLERYAALVVLLAGGLEVQIHDGEFVPSSGREVEQRLAKDGVICDFHGAPVLKNQKRRRQRRIRLYGRSFLPGPFGGVRGRGIFHRGHIRAGAGAAAIEHCRAALVVGVSAATVNRWVNNSLHLLTEALGELRPGDDVPGAN